MFLCEECFTKTFIAAGKAIPPFVELSRGPCEDCSKVRACTDLPSKFIPPILERVLHKEGAPVMSDITAPEVLEIIIHHDGQTVWINIDGTCRLRACRIKELRIEDGRRGPIR